MTVRQAIGVSVALILAACSQHPGAAALSTQGSGPVHPESGLRIIPLTVARGSVVHNFRVEVAGTEQEQEKGLMFRTALGADEGMLFPMKPPRDASFWMHNTVIPLDIIYVGTNRRILNIAANATPYSDKPLASSGVAGAVLELNGGRAAALGIGPGDVVAW